MNNNMYINGVERKVLRQIVKRQLKKVDEMIDLHRSLFGFQWTKTLVGLRQRELILETIYDKIDKHSKRMED